METDRLVCISHNQAKKQAKKIVNRGSDDEEEEQAESSAAGSEEEDDDLNAYELEVESSDEDEEDMKKPAYELLEKKAQKLKERKSEMRKLADAEAKETVERASRDAKQSGDQVFEFPTRKMLEQEKKLGVDMSFVKARFEEILRVLSNFSSANDGVHSRKEYVQLLIHDLAYYYSYNEFLVAKFFSIFSPAEAAEFIQANEATRPLTVRVNTLKTRRHDLMKALGHRGVNMEPISWSKVAIQIFESAVPVGATPEYLAGHYMLQSASSMTAVVALDPKRDERILDMCSAPGGKTTYIAQLMCNTGTLIANDVHPDRLKSLSANLHRLGVRNAIVTNYDGVQFPKVMGGFDRVLLDAPCTGTGVISRDVSVKTNKGPEDIEKLVLTQKRLILAAIDSIDASSPTGGILVYATCSITVEENEAIVDYALRKRYVKVIDSGMEFGKPGIAHWHGKRFNEQVKLGRRYYPHVYNMDGFFICKLKKLQAGPRVEKKRQQDDDSDSDQETAKFHKKKRRVHEEAEEEPEFEEVEDDSEEEEAAPPPKKIQKVSENGDETKVNGKPASKNIPSKATVDAPKTPKQQDKKTEDKPAAEEKSKSSKKAASASESSAPATSPTPSAKKDTATAKSPASTKSASSEGKKKKK